MKKLVGIMLVMVLLVTTAYAEVSMTEAGEIAKTKLEISSEYEDFNVELWDDDTYNFTWGKEDGHIGVTVSKEGDILSYRKSEDKPYDDTPSLYKFTDNKRYVDGANDDLSGCYVASAVLKYLAENDITFENTEVIAMLAGGEEAGLRGSKAFFEAHPEYKNDGVETVFISADTIRDEDYMMIYERDMTGMVKNDKRVCDLLKRAGLKRGLDIPVGAIPLGSTDAAAASQAGIAAASIVAMDPAPAQYYHTRLDTADILNPDCIEKIIGVLLEAVFDFDENGI